MHTEKRRFDIQILRGVAVLAVVVYHALKDLLPKGFLGVDVFFVISGFLISGIILKQLEGGRFSFATFYARRARRLLPASLTTLAATSILAWMILAPSAYGDYVRQLLGALTFTANAVLTLTTGYFDGAAESKPLLHIWSLSLEEQFYFVAPLLLWLTPLRARPWALIAAAIASGLICLVLMTLPTPGLSAEMSAKLAFYSLPSRAWELLIGSLAAWVMIRRPDLDIPRWVKAVALAVVLAVLAFGVSAAHPGPDALVVTLATAVLLLGRDNWLPVNMATRAVGRIGDWSYSLYLIHWPLLSFAFIVYLGEPPRLIMLGLVVLATGLAWLQYRFVEQPFQRTGWTAGSRGLALLVGGTLLLGAAGTMVAMTTPHLADPRGAVRGLAANCDQKSLVWTSNALCRTGPAPSVLLWGDSFAEHLAPGLAAALGPDRAIEQVTRRGCAPTLGIAQTGGMYGRTWAKECLAFNDLVLEHIRDDDRIRYVIIASRFNQVFGYSEGPVNVDGRFQAWSPVAGEHLKRTIAAVRAAGKTPILIGPTPLAGFNVGECNARLAAGRPVFRAMGCEVTQAEAERIGGEVERQLAAIAKETGASLLLPRKVLCGDRTCPTMIDGQSLYVDDAHFTQEGSRYLARRLGIRSLLDRQSAGR